MVGSAPPYHSSFGNPSFGTGAGWKLQ